MLLPTRQNLIQKYLQSLHLNNVQEERNLTVCKRLEFLNETIIKSGNQGPQNFRGDADLFEYMHEAVARLDWAQTAKTQVAAADAP